MNSIASLNRIWKQIPGMPMWKNLKTGVVISVAGSPDKGWYVVRRNTPVIAVTSGEMVSQDISPYYIMRDHAPVGEEGALSNIYVRQNHDWQYGSMNDAISFAINYMKRVAVKIENEQSAKRMV
jgi:hypothetical protein